jgi:selenobiotic family peptide radical SAM maturase
MNPSKNDLSAIYPRCRSLLDPDIWQQIISSHDLNKKPDNFPEIIRYFGPHARLPEFLAELARLEWNIFRVKENSVSIPGDPEEMAINPTLILLELQWKNLVDNVTSLSPQAPEPGKEYVLIWKYPEDGGLHMKAASLEDLLILKMIFEGIDRWEVARIGTLPIFAVDAAMDRAVDRGIIIAPLSRIRRDLDGASPDTSKHFLTSSVFVLQWHITQACDLHCKHCYDRSDRSALTLEQALTIIDDLDIFCRERHVKGRVSFTGGNPLLHPEFLSIYKAAADRGFTLSVLGNPSTREQVEALCSIQQPDFFQLSLEGLPEYNDFIRGEGHFERSMRFLEILRELGVYTMVMLTVTKGNIHQVIPLGELLRGKTDVFYFNRLSKVGEGASLELPTKQEYMSFLERYLEAYDKNPVLGLKDNLINILKYRKGLEPFGGCTGFGCGAAFNFVAILADGEVHACRKFPSPIGNVFDQRIGKIYDSEIARRYRAGCAECRSCPLRYMCGGCLANAYSYGLDIFKQKDPYCFLNSE